MAEEDEIKGKIVILTKRDIHQAIYNYIHNDLKLSREDIKEAMEKKVEKVLEGKLKEFLNSKYFTELVKDAIMKLIKEGEPNAFYQTDPFHKVILREVREQVRNLVFSKYEVSIKEKEEKE
jgi:hypothetical protein